MPRRKSRFLRKPVEPFTVAGDLSAAETALEEAVERGSEATFLALRTLERLGREHDRPDLYASALARQNFASVSPRWSYHHTRVSVRTVLALLGDIRRKSPTRSREGGLAVYPVALRRR